MSDICKLMFTIVNYRRKVAVLTALALVASVLVAAPAAAADDPEPSYTAMFDACEGVPSSGFEDVAASHANAGDIDCIAYYGITKGTSATTYSPTMSVSREHMALFLTRLANRVGIDVVADPADPGFTDTGELSAGSQTAIAQLADLGITTGTSDTTYSPADAVTRGQMALFIARLMDLMDPMTDGVEDFGSTPSDVEGDNVGSPFTDLGSATKSAYDAITALYELGVASGISNTAYSPSASITRAAMAEFMAAVLDHSNARPAGLSIQADSASGYGTLDSIVIISVRDERFAPVADQAVDVFNSEDDALQDDGTCVPSLDCVWNSNDELTDESGNRFVETTTNRGQTNVFYAWIGEEDGDKFDADDVDEVTASISSMNDETGLKVTSNIKENAARGTDTTADDNDDNPRSVDLDATDSVTFTVQLVDNGDDVARAGIKVTVGVTEVDPDDSNKVLYNNTTETTLTTNKDGKATYTVEAPADTDDEDDADDRTDTIIFTGPGDPVSRIIVWTEDDAILTSGKGSTPPYVVSSGGKVTIKATATLYDQYGNALRVKKGQEIRIVIGDASTDPADDDRPVSSRGVANYTRTVDAPGASDQDGEVEVTYTLQDPDNEIPDITVESTDVIAVSNATDDSTATRAAVSDLYDKENKFRVGRTLYSYDSNDTFVSGTSQVDIDKFEDLMGADNAQVEVVVYDDDGSSIFRVST